MRRRLPLLPALVCLALSSCLGLVACGGIVEGPAAGVASPDSTSAPVPVDSTSETLPPGFRPSSALTPSDLATFDDFAIYSLGLAFEDLPLVEILREKESHLVVPNDPASRLEIDKLFLIYGTCDPGAGNSCAAPLNIAISPACRVNPTTYDGPADKHPLERTAIRGVPADNFEDSVILYAGDVAIKIFGEPDLALRAAAALAPANEKGKDAMAGVTAPGNLPEPALGALDGTTTC